MTLLSGVKRYRLHQKILVCGLSILASMALAAEGGGSAADDENMQLEQIRQLKQQAVVQSAKDHAQGANNQNQAKEELLNNLLNKASNDAGPQLTPTQQLEQRQAEANPDETAFASVANDLLPLSPQQVHRLKQLFSASKAAAAAQPGIPPKPTANSQFVNLAPGSTMPVIRLAEGFVTSLMFLDSTGAPWPIVAYDIGDPVSFNIQWNKKDNLLLIQAKKQYAYGNMAVRLEGLDTPVMLSLIPDQKAVDYRVDMRVEGLGPNAKHFPVEGSITQVNNLELLNVLDGVAPTGGQSLQVFGGTAQAWVVANRMFLRTRYTLVSPAWLSTLSSADGMNAYELNLAPLLLASSHGKVIQLKIKGF